MTLLRSLFWLAVAVTGAAAMVVAWLELDGWMDEREAKRAAEEAFVRDRLQGRRP